MFNFEDLRRATEDPTKIPGYEDYRPALDFIDVERECTRALNLAKKRAARKGRRFDLDRSAVMEMWKQTRGRCAVSDFPFLVKTDGRGGTIHHAFQASLDQIQPGQGYTRDNARLVLLMVNLAMNRYGEVLLHAMFTSSFTTYFARTTSEEATELVDVLDARWALLHSHEEIKSIINERVAKGDGAGAIRMMRAFQNASNLFKAAQAGL